MPVKDLLSRLSDGEDILVAEGYMFECERRGYVTLGAFTPEVVLEHPEVVQSIHKEFAHAGSDVQVAYTYYGNREKMRWIGREGDLEKLNMKALKIARDIADDTDTLMAGDLSNTQAYVPDNLEAIEKTQLMFKEQVEWAVAGGADYVIGETFNDFGEAMLALEAIKAYGNGLPAVITFTPYQPKTTTDGVPYSEAARKLEAAGAAVVGVNCARGPATMMPIIRDIRQACTVKAGAIDRSVLHIVVVFGSGPIAALPVLYRTRENCPIFQLFKDPETGRKDYPTNLQGWTCTLSEVEEFAKGAREVGVRYVGLCCGNAPNYFRALAKIYGRDAPALKHAPDLSRHVLYSPDVCTEGMKRLVKYAEVYGLKD